MNQIHEIDLVDRTVTVGPGINMLKLNEELSSTASSIPTTRRRYPCSLVGGRIGTGGWSLLGARFGHTRDLVISMEVVLPTGEIVEIGEGGGRKLRTLLHRRSTSSSCSPATRARSGSRPRRRSSSRRAPRSSSPPSSPSTTT